MKFKCSTVLALKLFFLILILNISSINLYSKSIYSFSKEQPLSVKQVLKKEKSIKSLKNLCNIINDIDSKYSNLYERLNKGGKIIIFMDPAHGKYKNGKWQGDYTWRQSCKGIPEEIYSIQISRKFYEKFKKNKYRNHQ